MAAEMMVTPKAGAMVRQDFGASELTVVAETASSAVAAQARAAVEARYKMALHRPRDVDDARARLLKECKRPGFAAKAIFKKPVGGESVEGPSIRFAEAAIRMMGNILIETPTIYDDAQKRIIRVVATDLETNATFQSDVVVEKTVERSNKEGRTVLGERLNAKGKRIYIVAATEDDLLNKVNAIVSKAVRTNGLRLLPADVLDDCLRQCRSTMRDQDAQDPDAAKKRLADAFAELNITPSDLKEYLGHDLATVSPKELEELRGVYAAINDGDTSWHAVLEARQEKPAAAQATQTVAPPPPPAAAKAQAAAPPAAPKVAQESPVREADRVTAPAASPPPPANSPPDPVDVLLAELEQVDSLTAVDAISKRAGDLLPKGHPRRNEVGTALNAARKRVQ